MREYAYIPKGGTGASSAALGVSEHAVVKTLLFQEADDATPFVVLQHGDASVDTKKLIKELERTRARHSGLEGTPMRSVAADAKKSKRAFMCAPEVAEQHTGYQVGGTSPFGLRDPTLRIFIESSLLSLLPGPLDGAAAVDAGTESATARPADPANLEQHRAEVARWDGAVMQPSFGVVNFEALDTAAALPATLDTLVSPAWVCINGGARGTLVSLSVRSIVHILRPIVISVAKFATPDAPAAAAAAVTPAASADKAAKKAGDKQKQAKAPSAASTVATDASASPAAAAPDADAAATDASPADAAAVDAAADAVSPSS